MGGIPRCPGCGKPMVPQAALGFFECVEAIAEKISSYGSARTRWGCVGMMENPKLPEWKKLEKQHNADIQKYKKDVKQYEKAQNSLAGRLGLKHPDPPDNPPTPIPPKPPATCYCKYNYHKAAAGKWNEKSKRQRKKVLMYDVGGKGVPIVPLITL